MAHIVSFYAPRPDHPYFQDYTPFLHILAESCRRFGHRHIIITDDPVLGRLPDCPGNAEHGIGEGFMVDLPHDLMQAILAGQLAYLKSPLAAEDTVLLGADCVLARDPREVFKQDFDIAFTTGNFSDCILNTGAIYIRGGAPVAGIWERALVGMGTEWGDDQLAVAAIVEPTLEPSVTLGPGPIYLSTRFLPVDPYNLAPEYPGDDCRRGYVLHFRGPRKRWMHDYCAHWLDIGDPVKITTLPNTPDETIYRNIAENSRRNLPWIGETEAHDIPAILVGGGPSVADDVEEIRHWSEAGARVFALNGAVQFLAKAGITPDFQVLLDARAENRRFLKGSSAAEFLIASQCDPSLFDEAMAMAPGCVALFHANDPKLPDYVPPGRHFHMLGGGITVGLTALSLAFIMGYRFLHLYGYDSSERAGENHAYEQVETRAESMRLEAWVGREKYLANPVMIEQVRCFEEFAPVLAEDGAVIAVHGDGLLPARARLLWPPGSAEREAA